MILQNYEASFVVYTTKNIELAMIYGVCINISGGDSRSKVFYQLAILFSFFNVKIKLLPPIFSELALWADSVLEL